MKNELISVIINVYNGEDYLKKCLDSIINQTYQNLEIIIVNDGSTDNTLKIINSYQDKRIKVITTKNQGLSLSRNVGIDAATGNYLYFVDVDDFIELDTIKYLYQLIKKHHQKIAIANYMNFYDYDFVVDKKKEEIEILDAQSLIENVLYMKGRYGTIWNKLFHKDLFKTIRFENRIVNDVVVIYKLYLEAGSAVFSNQIKYYYYNRCDSISGIRKPARTLDMYQASLERFDYLNQALGNFIANDIGILLMIYNIYLKDYSKIKKEYQKLNIKGEYQKHYQLKKVLKADIKFDDKIKLIIFRISPRLSKIITKLYLFIKK
ncbi:MAG: glycosyltransferase family 2 protein [Bacilli bacterium]|nr:glycosyltransferase family 2 protein [Bacilli bacterium]